MNPKERVYAALRKEPVDRVPIFMWYHPETARCLAGLLEIPVERLSDALGDDVRMTWVNNNYAMEGIVHKYDGESHVDEWGIEWTRQDGFNQITRFPLVGASPDHVRGYHFPEDRIEALVGLMAPVMVYRNEYFVGCDVSPCAFEMYWRLRGLEDAMADFAADRDLSREMVGRCADFAYRLSEAALDRHEIDWLWTGDDVGSQRAMMFSPTDWRDLVRPNLQHLFELAHSRHVFAAFHSCGAIRPIIGDLVEIGLDVLNPIQCNCHGMDPLELKAEFGEHLAFMGGVDTQGVLPNGTADEVRKATSRLIEGMTADGGGYILAASHTVPPETPEENIFAMYEAAGLTKAAIFDAASDVRARL